MNKGYICRKQGFLFIFLVVFDVGDEDKEECGGTKDLGGLGLGWKKARPLLGGWLGGNNVTIKKQRIISEQTQFFVYKLTHCGSMWASVNPSILSLHSNSISKSNSREERVFSFLTLTVPPHICACFEDFRGDFYSARLVLSLRVFFIFI